MECDVCKGTGYIKKKYVMGSLLKNTLRIVIIIASILLAISIMSTAGSVKYKILYLIPLIILYICLEIEIIPEFIIDIIERNQKAPCPHCIEH
jgi:hypothetical protein